MKHSFIVLLSVLQFIFANEAICDESPAGTDRPTNSCDTQLNNRQPIVDGLTHFISAIVSENIRVPNLNTAMRLAGFVAYIKNPFDPKILMNDLEDSVVERIKKAMNHAHAANQLNFLSSNFKMQVHGRHFEIDDETIIIIYRNTFSAILNLVYHACYLIFQPTEVATDFKIWPSQPGEVISFTAIPFKDAKFLISNVFLTGNNQHLQQLREIAQFFLDFLKSEQFKMKADEFRRNISSDARLIAEYAPSHSTLDDLKTILKSHRLSMDQSIASLFNELINSSNLNKIQIQIARALFDNLHQNLRNFSTAEIVPWDDGSEAPY